MSEVIEVVEAGESSVIDVLVVSTSDICWEEEREVDGGVAPWLILLKENQHRKKNKT